MAREHHVASTCVRGVWLLANGVRLFTVAGGWRVTGAVQTRRLRRPLMVRFSPAGGDDAVRVPDRLDPEAALTSFVNARASTPA